jgi:general stress protein CsbA
VKSNLASYQGELQDAAWIVAIRFLSATAAFFLATVKSFHKLSKIS